MTCQEFDERRKRVQASPYSLVIVDMQPQPFGDAITEALVDNVVRLIEEAKAQNCAIVVLCNDRSNPFEPEFGPVHERIHAAVNNYMFLALALKTFDSGSCAVRVALGRNPYAPLETNPRKPIKVCGVKTDLCVKACVLGLAADYFPPERVEVVRQGCYSPNAVDWSMFDVAGVRLEDRPDLADPASTPVIGLPQS